MLTKQEREEIAKRVKIYTKKSNSVLSDTYECLIGRPLPSINETTASEDREEMANCLLALCDTSNMLELPVDKDSEVIRIGDMVYDKDGDKYEVMGYEVDDNETNIILDNESGSVSISAAPNELTHKQPVTIESLVARIKRVMDDDSTTVWAYDELCDIADKLEKLGDSDD